MSMPIFEIKLGYTQRFLQWDLIGAIPNNFLNSYSVARFIERVTILYPSLLYSDFSGITEKIAAVSSQNIGDNICNVTSYKKLCPFYEL